MAYERRRSRSSIEPGRCRGIVQLKHSPESSEGIQPATEGLVCTAIHPNLPDSNLTSTSGLYGQSNRMMPAILQRSSTGCIIAEK